MIYLTFIQRTCKFEEHKQSFLSENCEQTFPNKNHKKLHRSGKEVSHRSYPYLENTFQPNTAESTEVLPDVIRQDSVKIPLTSPAEVK